MNDRVDRKASLFEEQDPEVVKLANDYWNRLVASGKVDDSDKAFEKKRRIVDVDTIKNKDAREVEAKWMCFQALEQHKLKDKLIALNWNEEIIQLALTQIISRAVYSYSEHRTSRWIKQNSVICEITGYPMEKVTKDKLYKSALDLYKIKDTLEQHLSHRTNKLFDLKDKIILYDLPSTYFEGSKRNSKLAQYAKNKSKEKRNEAKIIVLALVVNVEGFIMFSSVFEGKKSDSSSLTDIIDKIRLQTSNSRRAIVVIDAGIATNDNLELIKSKRHDYVCVEKGKVKDYQIDPNSIKQKVISKAKDVITLESVVSEKYSD